MRLAILREVNAGRRIRMMGRIRELVPNLKQFVGDLLKTGLPIGNAAARPMVKCPCCLLARSQIVIKCFSTFGCPYDGAHVELRAHRVPSNRHCPRWA
jgi:hypothetical protein